MKTGLRWLVLSALVLASADACAHGSAKGLGSFFGGVVHPLIEPSHLISLTTFALLIGPRFETLKPVALWFAGGSVAGGVLAAFGMEAHTDTLLLVCAALVGLAVVIARPLPVAVYRIAAVAIGLGIGLGSLPDSGPGLGPWVSLAGSCIGAPVFMVNLAMLVEAMKKPWMRILVRVFGSWATACAILVLSLVAAGRPLDSIATPASAAGAVAPLDLRRN